MIVGDVETIATEETTRVSITNPDVADVLDAKPYELSVLAKRPGRTEIFIWDNSGKKSVVIQVFGETLDLVERRIAELIRNANLNNITIERNNLEGKIVLLGEIEQSEKSTFDAIISPFNQSIINLVKENQKKELVEIDVQIFEVSASHTQQIGVTWANLTVDGKGGTGTQIFAEDEDSMVGNIQKFGDIFKIGKMGRTTLLTATINMLIEEGKAKVLSKPKIVVRSGEEASFHVGGQVPVRSTTVSGDTVTENFIFQDYGVQVTVVPLVELEGKIDIDLNVDVSDVDADVIVDETVGYTKRTAKTKLYLDDGQTIVLAGFIKDNKAETIKRVPILGSLPLIGYLFKSKQTSPDRQTELFITLTPRIVAGKRAEVLNEQDIEEADEAEETAELLMDTKDEKDIAEPSQEEETADTVVLNAVFADEDSSAQEADPELEDDQSTSDQYGDDISDASYDNGYEQDESSVFIDQQEEQQENDSVGSSSDLNETEVQAVAPKTSWSQSHRQDQGQSVDGKAAPLYDSANVPAYLAPYLQNVQKKISESIVYPLEARQTKQQGTVRLDLLILQDGTLLASSVRDSSGYFLLDKSAMETVKQSSPFGVFPQDVKSKQLSLSIPIVYQLE